MKHYSTFDYISNDVSFANFFKHCLNKFKKVSEMFLILTLLISLYIVHSYT